MSTYYCHSCARAFGLIHEHQNNSLNLTGNSYLFGKYLKHHPPVNPSGIVSIYDDANYEKYKDFTISGSAAGAVEVDSRGRNNSIFFMGEEIGAKFEGGVFQGPADSVKVVLSHDTGKMHSYPIDSSPLQSAQCADCGAPIIV